ncbi:MAG TPA: septation protein SepH, partial [Euzebya sp.]|nr:septation protein SepH [Euzebya sp.]
GVRFRLPVSSEMIATLIEVLQTTDDGARQALLADVVALTPDPGSGPADRDGPSAAAALVALGRSATGHVRKKLDGSASRLSPSEIQRMLRAGKSPESVAEQAAASLDWVLRWNQPIEAEQRKVITSVLGGRQDREGFGISDDLIGDAVRINLLQRDVETDSDAVQWTAARPEGRPYWTVAVRFSEGERIRRATWRYDIGTGKVTPRDDLAVDLGWTRPVTHPTPGRQHMGHQGAEEDPPAPPKRAAPPPPPGPTPVPWAPPPPPASPRVR